jgi:hypothetical protein
MTDEDLVRDMLGMAVLLGCDSLEITENQKVLFLDESGEAQNQSNITPAIQKVWSSESLIHSLKSFAGVQCPHRNYPQRGGFGLDLAVGGVVEQVRVLVENDPVPLNSHDAPEILKISIWIKPWMPVPFTAIFAIAVPVFLFFFGLFNSPLPLVWAWGLLFLGRTLNALLPATPSVYPHVDTGFGRKPRVILRAAGLLTTISLPFLAFASGSLLHLYGLALFTSVSMPMAAFVGGPVVYVLSRVISGAFIKGFWAWKLSKKEGE